MSSLTVVGEPPVPKSLVAVELFSGEIIEKCQSELQKSEKPFDIGDNSLIVTDNAPEVLGCFLHLQWLRPDHLIDIGVEARCLRNGFIDKDNCSLVSALAYYNFEYLPVEPVADDGARQIEGCREKVQFMISLFDKIEDEIDYTRALLRGRYLFAVSVMERNGIPIDVEKFEQFKENRIAIRKYMIDEVDTQYNVYDNYKFSKSLFTQYLNENKIPWPKLESGSPDIKNDTFMDMVQIYPQIYDLWNLKILLGHLVNDSLTVGSDGRNRSPLVPFKSKTGRNQPSSTKHIFGNCVSLRSLIKPSKGKAIAYIDWSQQEFGIAAALSKDQKMTDAYNAGDPYLAFAVQVGAAPSMATKDSHPEIRETFKECILATQYGMGANSLSNRIDKPIAKAQLLLDYHRNNFSQFWQWSDQIVNKIMMHNVLKTKLGWQFLLDENSEINERSLRNFPMQANGAEIMRIASIFATEAGIKVCTPVHDALLIESSLDQIDEDVERIQALMQKAGEIVLDGFKLRSDVEIFRFPERYIDKRGIEIWNKLNDFIEKI